MADERSLTDAINDDASFPAADVSRELHPEKEKDFKADSGASQAAKDMREKSKDSSEKMQEGKKDPKQCPKKCPMRDPMQALKTTLIVSGVILVVAGAVFAVTKKMKEK